MLLKVRVNTNAKNEAVIPDGDDHFRVSVREKPEGNAANKRVVHLLASHFSVPVKQVRIISGHHRPSKIVSVDKRTDGDRQ